MNIILNDKPEKLAPEIITVADLLASRHIPSAGTAVAVNGKIVRQMSWAVTSLDDGDKVMIISATYGG